MRVWWESGGAATAATAWRLRLRLDEDENLQGSGQGGAPITLVTNTCTVRLPVAAAEPHPDLLALAALLIVRPWTRTRISFDRPISPTLAEGLAEYCAPTSTAKRAAQGANAGRRRNGTCSGPPHAESIRQKLHSSSGAGSGSSNSVAM